MPTTIKFENYFFSWGKEKTARDTKISKKSVRLTSWKRDLSLASEGVFRTMKLCIAGFLRESEGWTGVVREFQFPEMQYTKTKTS